MRKPVLTLGMAAAAAVLLAACGSNDGTTATTADNSGGGDAGKVMIMSPKNGASVKEPFTLKFNAGDIGPTDSGKDHVHVFTDGKETDYTVVTQNSFQIKGLSPGEHTINVTKQHADHSPTGAKAEIKVKVTGGSTSGGKKSGGDQKDQPDYGY